MQIPQSIILLIDDNHIDIYLNSTIISKVNVANKIIPMNCVSALAYLKDESNTFPTYIFLDINMPVMNGFEFLDAFEKLNSEKAKKCKIFVLSSSSLQSDIDKSFQYKSVKQYLKKPLNLDIVKKVLTDE